MREKKIVPAEPTEAMITAGVAKAMQFGRVSNGICNAYRVMVAMDPCVPFGDQAHHIDEYHEDFGDVLWWTNPVREAPYVGSPNDLGRSYLLSIGDFETVVHLGGWPGYHQWWTPLPSAPVLPSEGEAT